MLFLLKICTTFLLSNYKCLVNLFLNYYQYLYGRPGRGWPTQNSMNEGIGKEAKLINHNSKY